MKIKVLFLSYCLLFLSCEDVFEKDISRKKVEVMVPERMGLKRSGAGICLEVDGGGFCLPSGGGVSVLCPYRPLCCRYTGNRQSLENGFAGRTL